MHAHMRTTYVHTYVHNATTHTLVPFTVGRLMDENDTLKKEASEQTQRHIEVCCSYVRMCVYIQSTYIRTYVRM